MISIGTLKVPSALGVHMRSNLFIRVFLETCSGGGHLSAGSTYSSSCCCVALSARAGLSALPLLLSGCLLNICGSLVGGACCGFSGAFLGPGGTTFGSGAFLGLGATTWVGSGAFLGLEGTTCIGSGTFLGLGETTWVGSVAPGGDSSWSGWVAGGSGESVCEPVWEECHEGAERKLGSSCLLQQCTSV